MNLIKEINKQMGLDPVKTDTISNQQYFDMYIKGTYPDKYSQDLQGYMHYISNRQQVLGANIGLIQSSLLTIMSVSKKLDMISGGKLMKSVNQIEAAIKLIEGK